MRETKLIKLCNSSFQDLYKPRLYKKRSEKSVYSKKKSAKNNENIRAWISGVVIIALVSKVHLTLSNFARFIGCHKKKRSKRRDQFKFYIYLAK